MGRRGGVPNGHAEQAVPQKNLRPSARRRLARRAEQRAQELKARENDAVKELAELRKQRAKDWADGGRDLDRVLEIEGTPARNGEPAKDGELAKGYAALRAARRDQYNEGFERESADDFDKRRSGDGS